MKKVIAIILTAMFLALPVFAGYDGEANEGKVAFGISGYAEKPVIDGKLDEYGYAKVEVGAGDVSYAFNDTTDGADSWAKNLKYDLYMSYDADYLYTFVSMDANHYFNDCDIDTAGSIWGQSAIQMNLAAPGNEGTDRLEFGIGRNSANGELLSTVWQNKVDVGDAGSALELTAGTDFQVVLDGGKINYEVRTPVNTFLPAGKSLAQGDKITFCLVMAQCDKENAEGQGTGGYIHTQIASGCTGDPGKAAQNFATLTLSAPIAGRPAVVDEPVVAPDAGNDAGSVANTVTTPAVTAVPPTGDNTMILVSVMILAAASFVIFRKKAAVK